MLILAPMIRQGGHDFESIGDTGVSVGIPVLDSSSVETFAQSNDLGVREVQEHRHPGVHLRHVLSDGRGPDEGQGLV